MSITIEFCILKFVEEPNFNLKWQFWFFGPNFPKNGISGLKRKKWASPLNLHIQISQSTKFPLKKTILGFWTKFFQKKYFRSKTEEMSITNNFCILKLDLVRNFSLKWQFWFFGPNLPQNGIFSLKRNKWASPLNSPYSN